MSDWYRKWRMIKARWTVIPDEVKGWMVFFALIGALLLFLFLTARPTSAHDMYEGMKSPDGKVGCCGGNDCDVIPYDRIRCNKDGCVIILGVGEHPSLMEGDPDVDYLRRTKGPGPWTFFYKGTPYAGPDNQPRVCIALDDARKGKARCVWVGGAS